MRKLNKKNKISFNIFGIAVLLSLAVMVLIAVRVMGQEKEQYPVGADSVIYDDDLRLVSMKSSGTIEKKWTGDYHLTVDDTGYNLGKHNVFYDSSGGKVSILGSGYQVFTDGSVKAISKRTDIENTSEMKFYKLADRKYLICGLHIESEKKGFDTSRYLYVHVDKAGNAQLLNDEINMKTVKPMVLVSAGVKFDIANEKLIYKKDTVDLKAINGSTNEYKEAKDTSGDKEEESSVKDKQDSKQGSRSQTYTAPGQGGFGGNGAGGTSGGNGTSNNNGNHSSNQNSNSSTNDKNQTTQTNKNEKVYDRSIALRSVESGVDSLTIGYYISDVENKFLDVHLTLEDAEGEPIGEKYPLNKSLNQVVIRGLSQNEKYRISLNYSMYYVDKGITKKIDYTADEATARTKTMEARIQVDKITDKTLHYTVFMDRDYVLSSAELHLYTDDAEEADAVKDVNMEKAIGEKGWSDTFKIQSDQRKFKLKLENTKYNGETVDLNVQCTVVNERVSTFADRIIEFFKK